MASRPYAAALAMDDEDAIGVIRYDGDPDVFTALAWKLAIDHDCDYTVRPPEPRLYRVNPDTTGEFSWLLAKADRRGHGVFLGALVRYGRYMEPAWMRDPLARANWDDPEEASRG